MNPLQKLAEKLLPSMPPVVIKRKPVDREKRRQKKLEKKQRALEESQAAARLRAIQTGEGLEVLGCEVCATPLRFKVCMNPGCHHVNPRAPEFIGVPNNIEGKKET